MDKLLVFPGASDKGIFTYVIDTEHKHLIKTAAEYHPTIASYITSAKKIPGKTQILLTALGAGEWWGDNQNGDFFPEAALAHEGSDYGYKTFQLNAKIYKHHVNKNPEAAYGDVSLSVYNPNYHRVELIVLLDNAKAPDIAERINSGEYPEWSMGAKVPYDVCSICGNKAPTRKQYCEHLRYYMGRLDPATGRKVFAINLTPNFFDISQVLIGADKIAKTLKKVASLNPRSAYLAEKMAETSKAAMIVKEVPASTPPGTQDALEGIMEVKAREPALPTPVLNRLGNHSLPHVLSTLAMMGILPKPQEFQRIILVSIGKSSIADQMDKHNMCFDPMSVPDPTAAHMKIAGIRPDNFDPAIFEMMKPYLEKRSYYAPFLGPRVAAMIKEAACIVPHLIKLSTEEERKPIGILPMLLLAAGLYAAFSKGGPEAAGHIDSILTKHPYLAAALGIGAATTLGKMFGNNPKGQLPNTTPQERPDVTDPYLRVQELRERPLMKVGGGPPGVAAKSLLAGIPLAYLSSGVLQKQHEADPGTQKGGMFHFIRRHPDIISAGLILNAIADSRGRGVYSAAQGIKEPIKNLTKSVVNKIKSTGPLAKTATASEFLSNALIWPIAFGKAGLPGRMVGGVFDQAVVEASRKLLSNKENPNKLEVHRKEG